MKINDVVNFKIGNKWFCGTIIDIAENGVLIKPNLHFFDECYFIDFNSILPDDQNFCQSRSLDN